VKVLQLYISIKKSKEKCQISLNYINLNFVLSYYEGECLKALKNQLKMTIDNTYTRTKIWDFLQNAEIFIGNMILHLILFREKNKTS
jgi:hypothetical protein